MLSHAIIIGDCKRRIPDQRAARKPLDAITLNSAVTERLYRIEAVRRVSERFTANHR